MAKNLLKNSEGFEKHDLYREIAQVKNININSKIYCTFFFIFYNKKFETYEETLIVRESSFVSKHSSGQ